MLRYNISWPSQFPHARTLQNHVIILNAFERLESCWRYVLEARNRKKAPREARKQQGKDSGEVRKDVGNIPRTRFVFLNSEKNMFDVWVPRFRILELWSQF